jgi:hypothetical protein
MAPDSSISVADEPKDGKIPWDGNTPFPFKPKKLEATIKLPKECTTFTFDQLMEAYNEGIKIARNNQEVDASNELKLAIEQSKFWEIKYMDIKNQVYNWVQRKLAANADGSGHTPDPLLEVLEKLYE